MKRNAALDGFRGIAILLVLAHHLFGLLQGWIGVDIFFVLSGYLITTILLNERHEQHFWRMFYTRRVTRIGPAFVALLLITTSIGVVKWRVLWPYLLFFGANFGVVQHRDLMISSRLSVLWSLAIEEHFYFIWPMQVRRLSRPQLAGILTAVLIIEPIARSIMTLHGASWSVLYFLTPFRLDGLAIGSLLAVGLQHKRSRTLISKVVPWGLPIGALVLAASFPFLIEDAHVLFLSTLGYSLTAVIGATVLAYLITHPSGPLPHIMSSWPFVFLGQISYGLYLCHMLIYVSLRTIAIEHGYFHFLQVKAVSTFLAISIAWLSFHYFEKKFLDWGKHKVGFYREERAAGSQTKVGSLTL
jgi:peptidoglycan/LPS O-acetylase OafA/YrhL